MIPLADRYERRADDFRPDPPLSDRPRCPVCSRPLKPSHRYSCERVTHADGFFHRQVNHGWDGSFIGYGHFDKLRCAARFANTAYDAGWRMP